MRHFLPEIQQFLVVFLRQLASKQTMPKILRKKSEVYNAFLRQFASIEIFIAKIYKNQSKNQNASFSIRVLYTDDKYASSFDFDANQNILLLLPSKCAKKCTHEFLETTKAIMPIKKNFNDDICHPVRQFDHHFDVSATTIMRPSYFDFVRILLIFWH